MLSYRDYNMKIENIAFKQQSYYFISACSFPFSRGRILRSLLTDELNSVFFCFQNPHVVRPIE